MSKLTDPEKLEIVRLLAHFNTPTEVAVVMREQHGVEVDRFQVRTYDPTKARYEGGNKWRETFEAERLKYLHDIGSIPIAHKAFRLGELQKLYFRAQRSGNIVLACAIIAQASKELRGADGSRSRFEWQAEKPNRAESSPEEARQEVREMLKVVLARARDRGALPQMAEALAA